MKKSIVLAKKLEKKTVLEQITRLACHYPNSGHTKDTIKVVANDWYNEFKHLNDRRFFQLITIVLRTSRFFPTIADIVAAEGSGPEWVAAEDMEAINDGLEEMRRRLNVQ